MQTELFLDVRYYETDQMGIVHHSNYIRYFECGRSDLLVKIGLPLTEIEAAGVMMPIVSVECKYRTPARFGDNFRSEVRYIIRTVCSFVKAKWCSDSSMQRQDVL